MLQMLEILINTSISHSLVVISIKHDNVITESRIERQHLCHALSFNLKVFDNLFLVSEVAFVLFRSTCIFSECVAFSR